MPVISASRVFSVLATSSAAAITVVQAIEEERAKNKVRFENFMVRGSGVVLY